MMFVVLALAITLQGFSNPEGLTTNCILLRWSYLVWRFYSKKAELDLYRMR